MNTKSSEGLTFTLPDERALGYLSVGEGKPIFYFHGLPSSRLDVLYLQEYATSRNLQFIGVDRPGFGLSTYTPRTSLRDFGVDINYLADSLGFDTFTLIGYSGGGPSVLTYCTLFPERVAQAVIISSPSMPLNADEMFRSSFERFIVKLGSKIRSIGIWYLKQERNVWLTFTKDPTAFLASTQGNAILDNSSIDDARLIADHDFRKDFLRSLEEAYCRGEDSIQSLYDARARKFKVIEQCFDIIL
jgi:pimeloyl-ACP methyl ester carboxylesterase